jgi:hypothetical protein
LNYNEYIEESCRILAQTADAETDHLIQFCIRLQWIGDEVNHAFDLDNISSSPQLDAERIEDLSKGFNQELKQIEADFPAEIWDNGKQSKNPRIDALFLTTIQKPSQPRFSTRASTSTKFACESPKMPFSFSGKPLSNGP